jgi:capsular polysaccharide biosynthesis protein
MKIIAKLGFLKRLLSFVTISIIFEAWLSKPIYVLFVSSSPTTTNAEVSPLGNSHNNDVDDGLEEVSSVKKIIHLADLSTQYYDVKVHEKSMYNVDPSIGYGMPDIKVQSKHGIRLKDLNAFVSDWRVQTQYRPGERRYTSAYRAAVLEVPNSYAYTYGEDFVVADSKNVYNIGGCGERMEGWDLNIDTDGSQRWDTPVQSVTGYHRFKSLAILVHRFSGSYFHWTTEALPRLMLYLETLTAEQKRAVRYLVNKERYVRESLRLFGIFENRQVIYYDHQSVYQAGTIFLAAGTPCGRSPKTIMNLLQKKMHNVLFPNKEFLPLPSPPANGNAPPGLMVLLKRNYSRQMSNVDEVKSTLRKHLKKGQEIILFDDAKQHSLISQYMIFKRAGTIIGTHGGGLANIVWSSIGTKVIEVLPVTSADDGRRARVCYASIAGSLGLDYTMIPVENEEFDDPIEVPLDDLTAAIINA